MGISAEHRKRAGRRDRIASVCLATVLVMAAVVSSANASGRTVTKSGLLELQGAIERTTALIAERRRTSLTFRLRGRLGGYDFGDPPISWSMPRRLPSNPASRDLRALVFHSVCRENGRALHVLFSVNKAVAGGFFLADEAEYLHWIGRRHGFDLDFRGVFRRDKGPPPDDMRSINLRRRVAAALEGGRHDEALRLVVRFARLCGVG